MYMYIASLINYTIKLTNQNCPHCIIIMLIASSCIIVNIRSSIVVSIPACHAGDRGSIPRFGVVVFFLNNNDHFQNCL